MTTYCCANIPDFDEDLLLALRHGQLESSSGRLQKVCPERRRRFHSQVDDDAAHIVRHCGAVQLRLGCPG